MKSLLDRFRRRFTKWYQPDHIMKLRLKSLVTTEASEISCEEVFIVLNQFAEAIQRGENVLLLMPLVRQHLEICPDCFEEYESLLRMLQPASE